jgi:hypothetical protein
MGEPSTTASLSPRAYRLRVGFIIAFALICVVVMLGFVPPIAQDPMYHNFADQRTLLGIPHCLNVVSNAPFLVVGVLGLWFLLASHNRPSSGAFLEAHERWPFHVFFAGVALTAFGSGYYHLQPDNARLLWDRLPITVSFMAFFAITVAERISMRAGFCLLLPALAAGIGSAVYWHFTELQGQGDLRWYVLVQFYPLVAIPVMLLLFPPRYTRTSDIWIALAWYGLAKLLETHAVDAGLFAASELVSGHTLKHLAAATGAYWILHLLWRRRPVGDQPPENKS